MRRKQQEKEKKKQEQEQKKKEREKKKQEKEEKKREKEEKKREKEEKKKQAQEKKNLAKKAAKGTAKHANGRLDEPSPLAGQNKKRGRPRTEKAPGKLGRPPKDGETSGPKRLRSMSAISKLSLEEDHASEINPGKEAEAGTATRLFFLCTTCLFFL